MIDDSLEPRISLNKRRSRVAYVIVALSICFVVVCAGGLFAALRANNPPLTFPTTAPIVITEGQGMSDMASVLAQNNVIRSASFFKLTVALRGAAASLRAGTYRFKTPLTTFEVVEALRTGAMSHESVTLTIPEGADVELISTAVHTALPHISTSTFYAAALPYEGYLFPETYNLSPKSSPEDIITLLKKTFTERASPLLPADKVAALQVVTMASILEREGKSEESMAIISGILWKRLAAHMPLQVDATLEYERSKGSAKLTLDDLQKDSPYNTYTRAGLPPTPISNPGIIALTAALHPIKTEYWFYLTGTDGTFHYAKTFEQHKQNKARYLRP